MQILHYLPSLNPALGGPGRAVIDLCGALAAAGHNVTLATADSGGQTEKETHQGRAQPAIAMVPRPRSPGYWYPSSALRQIEKIIQAHELVHVHGMWEFANIQVSRLCRSLGKPYIISPHGMLDSWCMNQGAKKKSAFMALFGRRWLRNASAIHLTAESELAGVQRYVSPSSARVVPLLVDLKPYRSTRDPTNQEMEFKATAATRPRILFLSRLHPKKGLEILLRAAQILVKRGRRFSLVVAGDGELAYLSQLRLLAGEVDTEVEFLGMVTGQKKLALYQACDVFALPTQHENFGLVFIEALACGLPVVTTRGIALSSELESSGAAVLVERTPEQFADAIDRLILDLPAAAEMGKRGRHWAFDTFDPSTSLRRFESFYAGLVEGTGHDEENAPMTADAMSA